MCRSYKTKFVFSVASRATGRLQLSRAALETRMGLKCLAESNILLMRKRNHAFLLPAIALSSRMADRFASRRYLLKQLLNSVIAKYRDFSVSRRSIICLSLRLIDLLATDKSRYFAQPLPIIAHYWFLILYIIVIWYHTTASIP